MNTSVPVSPDSTPEPGLTAELVRVRLDLGYDGTDFAGWAVQPGQRTVAGELTSALAIALRLEAGQVALVVAGRTDAGVHAAGQVCHLDIPRSTWQLLPGRSSHTPAASLQRRLAGILPPGIRVHDVSLAPPGFDARFSALWRRYSYWLCDDPAGVPPLRRRDVLQVRGRNSQADDGRLDVFAMNTACQKLCGLHDFAAYCRPRQGATTIRTLLEYSWRRCEPHPDAPRDSGLVVATVRADAFCHSMVRALVGAALAVGQGKRDVDWPAQVLAGRCRDPGVTVVAAAGLVLEEVGYPPDTQLAQRAQQARARRDENCTTEG